MIGDFGKGIPMYIGERRLHVIVLIVFMFLDLGTAGLVEWGDGFDMDVFPECLDMSLAWLVGGLNK